MAKCVVCAEETSSVKYTINTYTLYQCDHCDTAFLYPTPYITEIDDHNIEKYNALDTEKAYFKKKNELYSRALRDIKQLKNYKSKGRLLDIGCSYGFYLDAFRSAGYHVEGLEVTPRAISYAQKTLKLKIHKGTLEDCKLKSHTYDIITMYDVIEHLNNPSEALKKIFMLLKPDGVLIVQTPNIESIISRLTKKHWFWLLIPQHVVLFTVDSLALFLIRHQYRVLQVTTWDDWDEWSKNILQMYGFKDKGKTVIPYHILLAVLRCLKPLSYIWSKYKLGGEILLLAQPLTKS